MGAEAQRVRATPCSQEPGLSADLKPLQMLYPPECPVLCIQQGLSGDFCICCSQQAAVQTDSSGRAGPRAMVFQRLRRRGNVGNQKSTGWVGFPGGATVENPPANAGDTGSSPGLGRSHMPRSNWAREPQLLSLRIRSLCSTTREAAIVRGPRTTMKSGPRSPQLEKALAQKRRPNTAKNK